MFTTLGDLLGYVHHGITRVWEAYWAMYTPINPGMGGILGYVHTLYIPGYGRYTGLCTPWYMPGTHHLVYTLPYTPWVYPPYLSVPMVYHVPHSVHSVSREEALGSEGKNPLGKRGIEVNVVNPVMVRGGLCAELLRLLRKERMNDRIDEGETHGISPMGGTSAQSSPPFRPSDRWRMCGISGRRMSNVE